jgi:pimeloyl-ACP methyl ester carboxylesterase
MPSEPTPTCNFCRGSAKVCPDWCRGAWPPCVVGGAAPSAPTTDAPTDMVADFAGWLDENFGAAAFARDRAETVEEGIARAQRARQRLLANGAKLVTHETIAAEMNAEREALIAAHRGHVRVTCDNCPMEQGASADCVPGCTAPLGTLWAAACLRGGATAPTPDPREVALRDLLDRYVSLVESGDAGHWDAEEEPVVIAARAALRRDTGASHE